MQSFTHHYDTHGGSWLEVFDPVIGSLHIAEQISSQSRHFGGRFFLAKADTRLFLDSYRAKFGEPKISHEHEEGESAIRLYPHFHISRLSDRTRRALRLNRAA